MIFNENWTWNRELNYITSDNQSVVCENIAATRPDGKPDHTPASDERGHLIAKLPDIMRTLEQIKLDLSHFTEFSSNGELIACIDGRIRELDEKLKGE